MSDPGFVAGLRAVPSGFGDAAPTWPASDLAGVRPDGTSVTVCVADRDRPLLLVFLTTDCDGCEVFWSGLVDPLRGVDVVVVTKGPHAVPASDVATLADGLADIPVVMSDTAWPDYRVTGYPFLILVEPGTRRIVAESVGFVWSDVETLVSRLETGPADR